MLSSGKREVPAVTLSTSQRSLEQALDSVQDASLILLLRRAEGALRDRLQRALHEDGLTPEHWRIMSFLREHPGSRMATIGEAAVLPSASLTRHVDKLVERGVVLRRVDPADRRGAVVALSPRGAALADDIRAVERGVEEQLAGLLGADRVDTVRTALAALPEALRPTRSPAHSPTDE